MYTQIQPKNIQCIIYVRIRGGDFVAMIIIFGCMRLNLLGISARLKPDRVKYQITSFSDKKGHVAVQVGMHCNVAGNSNQV